MTRLLFLSHPEVRIDPAVPVPDWGLSPTGRARALMLAARLPAFARVLASPEAKARETAAILAPAGFGTDAGLAEVDRSATGFLSPPAHEAMADLLFQRPEHSAGGWERAVDAQARIVAALDRAGGEGDLLLVGHGATGTFLRCHLSGRPISRAEDQPRQGCGWLALRGTGGWTVAHGWLPFEALVV